MGKLKKISNTSWRQFFNGNKKNYSAIKSQNEVATFCGLRDSTKRKLNIKFGDKFNINVTDIFTITSGLEILLPKAFRDKIGNIILNNPDSFFTVTVLDLVQKPLLSADEKEQEVIQKYLRKKSKAEIIKELLNLKDTAPEEYTINHKTYKRDNYTITLIKKIRGYKCQICGNSDNILPKFTSHRKYIITGYIAEGYGLISLDDRHEFSNYTSANNFLGSRVKSVVTR